MLLVIRTFRWFILIYSWKNYQLFIVHYKFLMKINPIDLNGVYVLIDFIKNIPY